jgi:Ca-activated chloride channel family protein
LHHTRLCYAFLLVCFLVCFLVVLPLPAPVSSSGAPDSAQQTPAAAGAAQPTQSAQSPQPATSDTLRFFVTVTDRKGGFISGLSKEEFAVWEDKTQSEINYFSREAPPASIGVLIDVSGSVTPKRLSAERYAAARFIQQSYTGNEYFIGEFNTELRLLTDWTRDVMAIDKGLKRLGLANDAAQQKPKTRGLTALYDTCAAALDKVVAGAHARRVLLLITDGQDTKSRQSSDAVRRKIRNSDALIYSISIEDRGFPDVESQTALDELTLASGGRAYFIDDIKELDVVVERLALELRQQYVIGFNPANAARAGKWNKVKIKVTPQNKSLKDLFARSREGYFSPATAP